MISSSSIKKVMATHKECLKKLELLSRQIPEGSPRQYLIKQHIERISFGFEMLKFACGEIELPDFEAEVKGFLLDNKRGQIFPARG